MPPSFRVGRRLYTGHYTGDSSNIAVLSRSFPTYTIPKNITR